MMTKTQTYTLLAVLLALLMISLWLGAAITSRNDGQFCYILDDAYIHMAMAKNMAEHGVWGITRHAFTSSSSSPLWTAVLSASRKLGLNPDFTPLTLGLVFALLTFITFFYLMHKELGSPWYSLGAAVGAFLLAPFFYLIFTGLEHGLHSLVSLVYLYLAAAWIAAPSSRLKGWLIPLTLVLPMIRYEGLFLIAALVALLFLCRRFRDGLYILGSSLVFVTAYGLLSLSKGWYFLPSSVFLKGSRVDSLASFFKFLFKGLEQIRVNSHLLVAVLILLGLTLVLWGRINRQEKAGIFLFTATYLQHMFFARSGNFITNPYLVRYDAYLTLLALFLLFLLARRHLPGLAIHRPEPLKTTFVLLLLALAASPFITRSVKMTAIIPAAANDLYRQQYQTALFLKEHYPDASVALNDIGYPAYLSDLHLSDLLALSDKEAGDLILSNRYAPDTMDALLRKRKVEVIAVFDAVFAMVTGQGRPPASWIKVGTWSLPDNKMSAYPRVSFYALDPEKARRLQSALSGFSLPAGVMVQISGNPVRPGL